MLAAFINQSGQLAVEAATRRSNRLFALYIAVLVTTGLAIAYLTWLTWDASNRVQDAIQAEANARIQEANSNAAQANRTARELENANLRLQSDVEAQKGSVAILQTDAANAKAAQQRVEIDLAKQRTVAANAEKALAALKVSVAPRHVSEAQRTELIKLLRDAPKGHITIDFVEGDGESSAFAHQLLLAFQAAGWPLTDGDVEVSGYGGIEPIGLSLMVHSRESIPFFASVVRHAFTEVGISLEAGIQPEVKEGYLRIAVGHKPLAIKDLDTLSPPNQPHP